MNSCPSDQFSFFRSVILIICPRNFETEKERSEQVHTPVLLCFYSHFIFDILCTVSYYQRYLEDTQSSTTAHIHLLLCLESFSILRFLVLRCILPVMKDTQSSTIAHLHIFLCLCSFCIIEFLLLDLILPRKSETETQNQETQHQKHMTANIEISTFQIRESDSTSLDMDDSQFFNVQVANKKVRKRKSRHG